MKNEGCEKVAAFTFPVEPPEGNAQEELPLTLLVKRVLEAATLHAESWGVGYSTLIRQNHAWVLARLALEMTSYPHVRDNLIIETWIEGYNRHFSARNFRFKDGSGRVCGHARSIWSVIDMETRESVDLSTFEHIDRHVADQECPIEKQSKLRAVVTENPVKYPVRYSDIDLNRHVNSVKYIEHVLDLFSLEQYDTHLVSRFEISYMNEARYGTWLELHSEEFAPGSYQVEIDNDKKEVLCRGKVIFTPRQK